MKFSPGLCGKQNNDAPTKIKKNNNNKMSIP